MNDFVVAMNVYVSRIFIFVAMIVNIDASVGPYNSIGYSWYRTNKVRYREPLLRLTAIYVHLFIFTIIHIFYIVVYIGWCMPNVSRI